ncbi:MAG: GntR family transcriptional regulator [Rhodospirillales bacterium]|nr:GntR family transcriptional regulator [Rhodospirillales bacterium]
MTPTDLAFADTEAPVSLAEKAYQLLVRKITRLELPPGAVLVEKNLMAELAIGRTPIREAMQRIAAEGLVQHLPNRGMLVNDIGATNVQSIYEFRSLVEGSAARLAAQRATEDDIRELRSLDRQLNKATEDGDIDEFVALDRKFHAALARASKNIYLEEAVPRIFNLHLRLWFYIASKSENREPVAHSHDEMTKGVVDAIVARQPDKAEEVMTTYIGHRHQEIKGLL